MLIIVLLLLLVVLIAPAFMLMCLAAAALRGYRGRHRYLLWLIPALAFAAGMYISIMLVINVLDGVFSGIGAGFVGPT